MVAMHEGNVVDAVAAPLSRGSGLSDRPDSWVGNVAASWRRCLGKRVVDPESRDSPNILTAGELKQHVDAAGKLMSIAQEESARLHAIASTIGYAVLVCSPTGVVVDFRGNSADTDQFKYWGTYLGGVWSEDVEGTNGIGTCIVEQRPVTVHRAQHFRLRHASLSCSTAPIFTPQGRLAAVIDLTSIDPTVSDNAHAMALAVTIDAARAIEERLFRDHFRARSVILLARPGACETTMLVAVDRDHRIVGGDRNARSALGLDEPSIAAGVGMWTIFRRAPTLLGSGGDNDVRSELTHGETGEAWGALITPAMTPSRCRKRTALHTRPRRTIPAPYPAEESDALRRGGLSPRALRRVRAHIDAHLDEKITLEALAGLAGLSLYHFARAFKNELGVPPYRYVLERRIKRAQEMLSGTDLPIMEIALAAGFSDHTHFTRQFRRLVGIAPSTFRRRSR